MTPPNVVDPQAFPHGPIHSDPSSGNMGEEEGQVLAGKPSLSIRTRITLGFFICFLMALGITLGSLYVVFRLEEKLYFLKVADNFSFEIQQARRFEKNYFLYGTNLVDALHHVGIALTFLESNNLKIAGVIGKRNYNTLFDHTEAYRALLEGLQVVIQKEDLAASGQRVKLESDLRLHGAEMISLAFNLVQEERQAVEEMLALAKRVPVYFLIFLFLLMGYLTHLLTRQILGPLKQILGYTRRISEGDFTPVIPTRPYKDEFSVLILAMDRMLKELSHRQEILVQSHKLRAVGNLTAGVAHELNNPINNISLTAHLLLEDYRDLPDEERLDMIRDLISQADRSQGIIRNLLDFAREGESKIEPLDLGQIIQETVRLAGNQIKISGAHLDVSVLPHLPRIHGDHQQLSQVFLNIILNAIDVIPKGGRIQVSVAHDGSQFFIRQDHR